jgi:HTH-type transcriptional regulator / antitoxin HipB
MFIPSPKELALLMSHRRKQLKLSQSEIGQRVGLKQQTISEFELKPEHTQIETLFRLLSALDLKILPKEEANTTATLWKAEW